MSELTRIKELRKEIESLCGNCDRPDKEQLGKIILSSMALGFSCGMEVGRPQGEWKPKNHHTDYCSECGFEETQWRTTEYKFCPNCGAMMKGADDE